MGTKGTLILRAETEAFLFEEGDARRAAHRPSRWRSRARGPALDASESQAADAAAARTAAAAPGPRPRIDRLAPYRLEISRLLLGGPHGQAPAPAGRSRAIHSAKACILANEAVEKKTRLAV